MSQDHIFKEAKSFHFDGKLDQCINSLSEILTSSEENPHARVALCLRALCTQQQRATIPLHSPKCRQLEKRVEKDLTDALQITSDSPITSCMLLSIIDVASIRGLDHVMTAAHKLLFASTSIDHKKLLNHLWETRRLSHALCVSSLNQKTIENLSSCFNEDCNLVDFWIDALHDAELVGWKNSFSLSFSDFCCGESDRFHMGVSIDEVVKTVEAIDLSSEQSRYSAAFLYFDLADRVATKGRIIEALTYALKAVETRKELYDKYFAGEDSQKTDMWTKVWSSDTADFESFCLSPWSILRCYLESLLQVSSLYEMNGNEKDAENGLEEGENISCSYGLSLFKIFFSSALGNIYKKSKKKMDKKEREKSKKASDYFKSLKDSFTCGVCNWLIRGRILLDRLDLDDPIEKKDKASLSEQLKSMPKISVDCVVSNHGCICHRAGCWQCMPLDVLKSRSVQKLVDLKYQFFCRRLGLSLLRRSGNHAKVSETADIIRRSHHFLFNRAYTFDGDLSIYSSLLAQQVQGTALAIEQAELIYYATFLRICASDTSYVIDRGGNLTTLMLALVLSREVPPLFQKVSRLLAAVLSFLASKDPSRLLFGVNVLELASYMQQVSQGSRINVISKGGSKTQTPSLAPDSIDGFPDFVEDFFRKIPPSFRIICITVLGQSYAPLFKPLFGSCPAAWILISCLMYGENPIVLFLPVKKILKDSALGLENYRLPTSTRRRLRADWSEWDVPLVDYLAPEFTSIMQAVHLYRKMDLGGYLNLLDKHLEKFLKDLEDSWFLDLGKELTVVTTPVVFILDQELEALPLESMPMFRGSETYRMPSMRVIFETVAKRKTKKKAQAISLKKGFYLSNPDNEDGVYRIFQEKFKSYLQSHIKGYAGLNPGVEKLLEELRDEDIFIYLGHNSGNEFIPEDQIRKLDTCAAGLLLGCESAAVNRRGAYFPDWTPHSFLCGGAPFAVCSLWTLYDDDIFLFVKRLYEHGDQVQIGSFLRDANRLGLRNDPDNTYHDGFNFLLPHMFGAALVCYGLPTLLSLQGARKRKGRSP